MSLTINGLSYAIWAGGRLLRRAEEKKRTADADRHASEDRLRRAVSDAPLPIVIHQGHEILHMSRGWSSASGFTPADTPTITKWLEQVRPGHSNDAKQFLERRRRPSRGRRWR